jgi:hypothetical protein
MILAEFIVSGPQVFVGEDLVCFADLLELLVGGRVIRILV